MTSYLVDTAVPTLASDDEAADAYGAVVASAGYSRRKLLDHMIAAQALVHRASLVTMNAGDYADIPELALLAFSVPVFSSLWSGTTHPVDPRRKMT